MIKLFRRALKRVVARQEGASLAEYGLLLALIALVCIVAITLLGSNIAAVFNYTAGTI